MTQWGYEENTGEGQGNENDMSGPKALRDAYAALKKQNEDTMAMVSELLNEKKKNQLATVFESLGVPGAQDVYQGDADPEKAKAWVESMRGVFGTGNQGGTPPVTDSTEPVAPALPASMQAQFQRMTEAGQQGVPMGNVDAAFAAVGDASDTAALIAAFQNGVNGMGG
jgi:hypothetical protein